MKLCRVAAGLAGLALAACAVPPSTPAFRAVAFREGTVDWRRGAVPLAGRVAFQTGAVDGLRIVVSNGAPLLVLMRLRGEWTASGSLLRKNWRGTWNTAPGALAGWLSLAEAWEGAAFAPAGDSEVRTARFSVRYAKRGAELRGMELVSVATGDRFRVTFPPAVP